MCGHFLPLILLAALAVFFWPALGCENWPGKINLSCLFSFFLFNNGNYHQDYLAQRFLLVLVLVVLALTDKFISETCKIENVCRRNILSCTANCRTGNSSSSYPHYLPASSFLFCWSSALCISRSVHCDLKCRGCQAWYRLNWYVAPEEKCLSMTAADRVWNLKRSKMTIFPSNEQLSQATTTTTAATLATIIIVRSVQKIQNTKLTTHSLTNSQLPSSPIKYFHSRD